MHGTNDPNYLSPIFLFHFGGWIKLLVCVKTSMKKTIISIVFTIFFGCNEAVGVQRVVFLTSGRNGWSALVWFAVWIHAPHYKGMFCNAANTIYGENKLSTLMSSSGKYTLHTHTSLEKRPIDLLCEKEEPVVGQTQESSAGHYYFQQMVQFSESDHLLLQINLCA